MNYFNSICHTFLMSFFIITAPSRIRNEQDFAEDISPQQLSGGNPRGQTIQQNVNHHFIRHPTGIGSIRRGPPRHPYQTLRTRPYYRTHNIRLRNDRPSQRYSSPGKFTITLALSPISII
jgi:hypothetical protein